ncbi:MAG: FtsX-like permease family protein [Sedimentisphaerales bacterium]|nr:FtsX-like permease family protein [Sedimentisphaerales bacterium]
MYKITLALKYFLKRKISYFAVLAVTLCVFIVVIVMTVMNGIVGDFKQNNYKVTGDCVVGTSSLVGFAYYEDFIKILEQQKEIAFVAPVIKSFALIRPKGTNTDEALEILGIDPNSYSEATEFGNTLFYNRSSVSDIFKVRSDPNLVGCVPGHSVLKISQTGYSDRTRISRYAYSISCFPLTAKGAPADAGTSMVRTKTFYVNDISRSGLPRIDGSIIYLPFDQVQKLCGMDGPTKRISRIHIKFQPEVKLRKGCEIVRSLWEEYSLQKQTETQAFLLGTVTVQNWKEFRRDSIAPMENEEAELIVMFGFVGLTTVFIVLVVFYMIISHKSKDIGILKSVGASKKDMIELFSIFAFFVGLLSSVIGLFAGWLFLLNINRIEDWLYKKYEFQLWDRAIYAIGDIPNRVNFTILLIIAAAAILACLVGAFFPSWQAARKHPAEILQVNQL